MTLSEEVDIAISIEMDDDEVDPGRLKDNIMRLMTKQAAKLDELGKHTGSGIDIQGDFRTPPARVIQLSQA